MSLWKVQTKFDNGEYKDEIIYNEGPYVIHPKKDKIKSCVARKFLYEVEESLVPPRIFEDIEGKKYIVPQWIEVHTKTTMDDVKIIKKEIREVKRNYVVKDIYTVQSGSNEYKVRHNPETDHYTCNCQGYWRVLDKSKGCKHIQEIKNK